jgi:uncharacterized protein
MAKYRILSLDGGGSWVLIQARALIELFGATTRGQEVLSKFDYVAANSGGSIVFAAMLEDMRLGEIRDFFLTESKRKTIFVSLDWMAGFEDALLHQFLNMPRYYAKMKLIGLQKLLPMTGGKTLAQAQAIAAEQVGSSPRFLITSFDYDRLRSIYFRSDDHSVTPNSPAIEPTTLAEAVHGSSNAPIKYFDKPAEVDSSIGLRRCWDGGLAACNNPVLAALNEVMANRYNRSADGELRDIAVLSIGTATVRLPMQNGSIPKGLAMEIDEPSFKADLPRAATAVLDDPPDAATFTVYTWLNGFQLPKENCPVVRMNPLIQPILKNGKWFHPPGLGVEDGVDRFTTLANMDMDAVQQSEVKLISKLADAWINGDVLNEPIRADDDLQFQLGQETFASAIKAWKQHMET